ncbi:unnamed protein product [Paramecium octaurelia]|uniref:Uncharacterized protein n=1 Tax=Paramecium octaurelia TaxID=43137 RepID=A0A8S1YM67_PAROT|nr:unnamed protein product [Paramecium octaurelia]
MLGDYFNAIAQTDKALSIDLKNVSSLCTKGESLRILGKPSVELQSTTLFVFICILLMLQLERLFINLHASCQLCIFVDFVCPTTIPLGVNVQIIARINLYRSQEVLILCMIYKTLSLQLLFILLLIEDMLLYLMHQMHAPILKVYSFQCVNS